MFATHNRTEVKRPAEKARADSAPRDKAAPQQNSLWQMLALNPAALQTKLSVSQPADPYEREADQIADQVMRMATPPSSRKELSFTSNTSRAAQRKCEHCDEEESDKLLRKESGTAPAGVATITPVVDEALSAPGQPLDSTSRGFFEPRLQQDFSDVRVHADSQADAATSSISARAFTLGRDVVFAVGEYAPETDRGRSLLAHELVHIVQQGRGSDAGPPEHGGGAEPQVNALSDAALTGGAAVPAQIAPATEARGVPASDISGLPSGLGRAGVLQRQDVKGAATATTTEKPKVDEKPKEDTAEVLVDDILKLLSPVASDADLLLKRELVEKQLAKPKPFKELSAKERKRVPAALKSLYESAMIARIKKFPGNATAILDKLFASVKGNTNVTHANEIMEMGKLPTSPSNVKASVNDVNEYMTIRSEFGSLENITKYYADVKSHSFLGGTPTIHKVLAEKLDKATQILKNKEWLEIATKQTWEVGGFNIRPNTRDPTKLSDHSFGWAIDINAKMNPYVDDFPAGLVRGLTGVSMFEGAERGAFKSGGRDTAENLLPKAQTLKQASTTFQTAFADEASLRSALITYLKSRLGATFEDKDFDLALVKNIVEGRKAVDAATAELDNFKKKRKKKKKTAPGKGANPDDQKEKELSTAKDTAVKNLETRITEFSNFLVKANLDVTKAAAEQEEERKEQLVATKGEGALKSEEAKKKKAIQDAEKAKKKKGYVPPPEPTAAEKKATEEKQAKDVRDKAHEFLISAYKVYLSTLEGDGTQVEAATIGTTATIAAHGFIDLAPELIAALTGSDGGGLHWLGATKGTKDFMHFELEHEDRPPKVVAKTETSEDKEETPTPEPEERQAPSGEGTIDE